MAATLVGGAFLGAFLNVVFDKLASTEVVNFIRGKKLGPLLERLKTTLKVVGAVLNDAKQRQIKDSDVKDWLSELKHVVYMADDLLNEISTKAATATPKEVTTNFISRFFNAQDGDMACRLKEIVDKLEHILKLKESLDLREIAMESSSCRIPSTSVQDECVYGRDGDKKTIIKLLLDDNNEKVSVIPIVGMGGVGKTTLAQMLYNDDNLNQNFNFDSKAWVCVSEAFDIVRVTKTLTEALTQQACQINDFNSLQEKLVEKLKGKKFFIILDDVWIEDYDSWNLLKKPFQYGMRGSKILVTTRSDLGEETMIGSKTRHLSFINYSSPSSENVGVLSCSKFLRTFLSTKNGCSPPRNDEEIPCTDLLNLEYLRVLSFRCFLNFTALYDSIGGLIHLRYLDLSKTGIESLPEALCNLYNLQTLKLEFCCRLTMLPGGMQKLVNLHYLGIDETPKIQEMPKGMGKLKQLQHLPYFIVGKHEEIKIKELGGLSNLHGWFSIMKLENVENGSEALEARMMGKKHIQKLELIWSLSSDEGCMDSQTEMDILCKLEPHQDLESLLIEGYRGTSYPDWVGKNCFHNMTSITLSGCKNCFMLPSLGRLPSLKHLSISIFNMLETVDASFFNNNDGGSLLTVPFPSLITLGFHYMPCWKVWSCSEQPRAFPLLKHLTLKSCPELKGDLPSHLPALEELKIDDCKQLTCSLPKAPAMQKIKIKKANKLDLQEFPLLESLELFHCSSMMSFRGIAYLHH